VSDGSERILWRISDRHDLIGGGGLRSGGRWHTRGSPIVYLAESPAAALLEVLVHLEIDSQDIPEFFSLLKIAVPMVWGSDSIDIPVNADWKRDLTVTRKAGDAWLAGRSLAIVRVPSVVIAETWNCLLNPEHPEAGNARIVSITQEPFDPRLFRFGSR
jgi:RES domain-containing protein